MYNKEVYLGDGLYAVWDGFAIWLRAPRPEGDHKVCLEPEVTTAFLAFINEVKEYVKQHKETP